MRLLVTGGSGFLGEYVLTEAARRGHETVALARSDAAPAGCKRKPPCSGSPCLRLRDSTERPITLTEGTNQLVGRDPDRIVKAARAVLAAPLPRPGKPSLWDGQAGRRIASALVAGHDARNQ